MDFPWFGSSVSQAAASFAGYGSAAGTRKSDAARRAKKQLNHRFPPAFILRILSEFNSGKLDAPTAASHLGISRARLYQLRTDYLKKHLSHLVPTAPPKKRTYRRFRRAHIGKLWQHDSFIHQWWPAARKQTLLLTIDDCSGLYVAGSFVESDTTWNHFQHFREAFERRGLPNSIYTDGLSLFGPSSSNDHADPRSEFQ